MVHFEGVHGVGLVRVDHLRGAVLGLVLLLGYFELAILGLMQTEHVCVFEGRVCGLVERVDFSREVLRLVELGTDRELDRGSGEAGVLGAGVRDAQVGVAELLNCALVAVKRFVYHSFLLFVNNSLGRHLCL